MAHYRKAPSGLPLEWGKYFRHHWEIIPIFALCGIACVGYVGMAAYMLTSRPDVEWYKGQRQDHYADAVEHPHVAKFIQRFEYAPNPELAKTYREMEKKEKELEEKQK